jgi:hypothetical protein
LGVAQTIRHRSEEKLRNAPISRSRKARCVESYECADWLYSNLVAAGPLERRVYPADRVHREPTEERWAANLATSRNELAA